MASIDPLHFLADEDFRGGFAGLIGGVRVSTPVKPTQEYS